MFVKIYTNTSVIFLHLHCAHTLFCKKITRLYSWTFEPLLSNMLQRTENCPCMCQRFKCINRWTRTDWQDTVKFENNNSYMNTNVMILEVIWTRMSLYWMLYEQECHDTGSYMNKNVIILEVIWIRMSWYRKLY